MRFNSIATLAPLALLVSAGAHAAPDPSALRPLCTAGLPAQCQHLFEVPPSATIPHPEFAARVSVASCTASVAMNQLTLGPNLASTDKLEHAIAPSLLMLDDVIANGDAKSQDLARVTKSDLIDAMVVRMRIATNDPNDHAGIEKRLAFWTDRASKVIAEGPSCPAPEIAI